MADIGDLINNPNFGRLYASSYGFQSAFLKRMEGLSGMSTILPTLRVNVNEDGSDLSFSFLGDTRTYERKPGQSTAKYLSESIAESRKYTRTRSYSPTGGSRNGAMGNRRLEFLSRVNDVDFQVSSVDMQSGRNLADEIAQGTGGKALTVVDSDTSTIVRMLNRKTGEEGTLDEILGVLGRDPQVNGPVMKRLKAFFNEVSAEVVTDASEYRVKALMYDPADYFSKDRKTAARIKRMSRDVAARGGNADDFIKQAYETLGDASAMMSTTSFERVLTNMTQEAKKLETTLKNGSLSQGSPQYKAAIDEIQKLKQNITDLRLQVNRNMPLTFRGVNMENYIDQSTIDFAKAEVMVRPDEEFASIVRRMSPQLSDEQIKGVDVLTLSTSSKNQLPLIKGLDPKAPGSISFMTLEKLSVAETARSNTATSAAFGSLLNPDNYLEDGLKAVVESEIKSIGEGNLTPGLKKMLDDLEMAVPDYLTPGAQERAMKSKEFAVRIKNFLASGGDLTKDPQLTQQLVDQVKAHHFALTNKSKVREVGYQLGSERFEASDMRFEMQGSTRAHLESSAFTRRDIMPGVLSIDHKRGRFGLSPEDVIKARKAFGGFDFDDSIYGMYRYDKDTKRLLYLTLRDPNAMGEYYIFDADITHDKNIPKFIRDQWKSQKDSLRELERAPQRISRLETSIQIQTSKIEQARRTQQWDSLDKLTKELLDLQGELSTYQAQIMGEVNRLNTTRSVLDDYFSGKEVFDKANKSISQSFVKEIDMQRLQENGLPAPNGNMWNTGYFRQSNYLSLEQIDSANAQAVAERIRKEARLLRSGQLNMSAVSYVSDEYSQYNQLFNIPEFKGSSGLARRFDQAFIDDAIRRAQDSGHILGTTINQYTVIDQFISSHLDFTGDLGVDQRIKKKLKSLLEDKTLSRIDRETLIDALTKEGGAASDLIEFAEKSSADNMRALGKIIRELDDFAAQEGIDFKSGLDPITFQERLATNPSSVNELTIGYGGSDYLLPDMDVKATQAKLLRAKEIQRKALEESDLSSTARANLSAHIGDDFTPQQLQKAKDLINDYEKARSISSGLSDDDLFRASSLGDTSMLDAYSPRGIQLRTLAQMDNLGSQDILAVARVLLNSGGGDLSMLSQAMPLDETGLSINAIYNRALYEDDTFTAISKAYTDQDLARFIEEGPDGKYRYTMAGENVIDIAKRDQLIQEAYLRAEYARSIPDPTNVVSSSSFERMGEFINQEVQSSSSQPSGFRLPQRLGELNQALRTGADNIAAEVTSQTSFRSTIRRLTLDDIKTSKAARSGLVALAAFAGIGIVHRLIKGDRGMEAANPYPLIPEGSKYESIIRNQGADVSPMTMANGSMTYSVRAHNVPDAQKLSKAIQGVLPNGRTTIYNSNAYQLSNQGSDSRSILQDRLG